MSSSPGEDAPTPARRPSATTEAAANRELAKAAARQAAAAQDLRRSGCSRAYIVALFDKRLRSCDPEEKATAFAAYDQARAAFAAAGGSLPARPDPRSAPRRDTDDTVDGEDAAEDPTEDPAAGPDGPPPASANVRRRGTIKRRR